MKIEEYKDGFIVRRGDSYFNFYVDHDRGCWSKHRFFGRLHATREDAENTIKELRRRDRIRRSERASAS